MLEEQFKFVGEAGGEVRVFDAAIPAGEWTGTVLFFQDFDAGSVVVHPGVEFVGPACGGLVGEDAVESDENHMNEGGQ